MRPDANGPAPDGPARSMTPLELSASTEASSGRPAGTREVGELVGFCRLPGIRAGAGDPGPRGTAQQPVTSRVSSCFGKDHPLSPVPPMVRQNLPEGNQGGHDDARGSGRENWGNRWLQVLPAEPIPGAADRLHDITSELLPKVADVDLHHIGARVAVVSPDLIEELGL